MSYTLPTGTLAGAGRVAILKDRWNTFVNSVLAQFNTIVTTALGGFGQDMSGASGIVVWENGTPTPTAVWSAVAGAEVFLTWSAPYGLTLSNNRSDSYNDLNIAAGSCHSDDADPADRVLITLASALTKKLDATWAVGTNQGMRASGAALANTTYHIFLIQRPDTGVVDIAADTSATGANLAANTSAAYTKKRRIGSIIRSGDIIVQFRQDGDMFTLMSPVRDLSQTIPGTSAVLRTLTVPAGIKVQVLGSALVGGHLTQYARLLVSDPDTNDTDPAGAMQTAMQPAVGSGYFGAGTFLCYTDTSSQVRTRADYSDVSTSITLTTFGWRDDRRS